MSDSNGQKPAGYGHDKKGAAGGAAYGDGKPGVAHTAPADKVAGKGDGADGKDLHHRRPRDRHPRRRDDLSRRAPPRHQAAASVLFAEARLPPGRQLPRLHGRDRRRARAGGKLHSHAVAGHEGQDPDRPRQDRAQHGRRASAHRPARSGASRTIPDSELWKTANAHEDRAGPLSQARATTRRARPQPSGDGGQSRRLHPVQSLRPRLPRSAGQ